MRKLGISIIAILALLLTVVLILYLTVGADREEPHLKPNTTCIHENLAGICKSEDSCQTNLASVKLEPCNKGDSSVVCCPIEEVPVPKEQVPVPKEQVPAPKEQVETDNNGNTNRTKRIPGEKAKEMCISYGKTANYKRARIYPHIVGPYSGDELICDGVKREILKKGGKIAKEKEFPHMVQIGNYHAESNTISWNCGGSIVSPEFILGAAHCPVSKDNSYAMVGTNAFEDTEDFYETHTVEISDVFIHPDFNNTSNDNDIALFKLSTELRRSERPICLDTGSSLSNMLVIATGFGLNEEGISKIVLEKIILKFVDAESCAAKYNSIPAQINPEHTICAYAEDTDTCEGDSGGPLQVYHSELPCMYTQIGITSFGVNCSITTDMPGVYTKVSHYIGWIEDIVWPE